MDGRYIIGIDIGGTNFRIGSVNDRLESQFFQKIPVRDIFCTNDALKDLVGYLTKYFKQHSIQSADIAAIAIGLPATLDKKRTVLLQAPNIPFMENLSVPSVLMDAFHVPVYIEKDVSMALYYDRQKYKIRDCEVLTGFYFGTGIGNAIMINGHILAGKDGTAGELGHIPVDGNNLKCGCGNTGCIENLAGGKYLAWLCQEQYKDTYIGNIFTEHKKDVLLLQFIDRMAIAVATEINILNPDYILIGGGVPLMKDFPCEYLDAQIHCHVRKPYPEQELKIIYTEDEENKCVVGAALYALEKLEL